MKLIDLLNESVNESASRTAMEIGGLTGMNKDAIQKFVDTHNLNIEKVFQFVKKGKLSDRMDFVTAVVGKPGNPIQKKMLKMFSESVNEAGDFAGWIAFYNGKRLEIKKSEANGIYGAKQIAIKKLKVPKSKQGLLAIKPAVEESVNEAMGAVDFKDGLVDYIGDNPKLDKAYNSMKNPKDFMKLLITTMRNDKKAKKLYSYFSKNRTKGALDIIQKLASGDI